MPEAAVSWVERDGKVLVVWNRRYRGWTLPGGLIEEGETPPQGMARELREETGLVVVTAPVLYDAPAELIADGPKNRGSHVWVFLCDQAYGIASPVEGPIMWVTRDEFLALCPFKRFYERMFAVLGWTGAEEPKSAAIVKHAGPVAYVTARLDGLLIVSELDKPASWLLAPVTNLLKDYGDRRVSIVIASEDPLNG